jgi:2-amino-4-hydroxy-6-hydroxymethyldihydropteridine diphosphokinase
LSSTYLIALGSNRRHHFFGAPEGAVRAAMEEIAALGMVAARSRIAHTAPLGPARRRFANAALVLESELAPPSLLAALKRMERDFGRRPAQRWADRVLDCDIILWSGGTWRSPGLAVPHAEFRKRHFVLGPASAIAPDWRDPVSGLTLAQSNARLTRARPLPR